MIRLNSLSGAAILVALMQGTSGTALAATLADPAPEAENSAAPDAEDAGDIVVLGRGETRQVQEVRAEDLRTLAPGSSPLKGIEKLPGVNFQSADAFGNYEWAVRISIRGFNQNQLGYTLDGIPLGDFSYGNNNGLHISRAISPENIALTRVTQGAGSVSANATNNLGGTIEFSSRAPAEQAEVEANATYGSENTLRGFARIDTGTLGGGFRAYLSYGYLGLDKWKGVGEQRQHVVNAKAVLPLGGDAQLSAYGSFSDRRENDYQDMSLEMIRRLGYAHDNISNNFALAVRLAQIGANRGDTGTAVTNPAAGTVYPAPFTSVDDAYYDAGGLRRDYLGGLRLEAPLAEGLKLSLSGYYHNNRGQGLWWTPYVIGTNGVPVAVRTTEYGIKRGGAFGALDWERGDNKLSMGIWWERNSFRQARRFYNVDDPATIDGRDHLRYQENPFATQWFFRYLTETVQLFVSDRLTLGDLTLSFGAKGYQVTNRATPIVQGGLAGGRIEATDWFQPSLGLNYKLGDVELFAGFAQVTRAFPSAATTGPFATTVAGFNALDIEPEASDTYEAGARLTRGGFQGVVSGYLVNFRNRLLSFRNGAGIVGNPAILQNVGGVRSYGIEATAQYQLSRPLRLFASYSHNVSTYRDDVLNADGSVRSAIRGRTVVDAPRNIASAEIVYDDGGVIGRVGANYMSRRFFTYTNDQSVPGRVLVDASIGYRFAAGLLKGFELQASVVNLFDKDYVATIGSNGFGDSGDNQTLLIGTPRQVFATLRTRF